MFNPELISFKWYTVSVKK